MTCSWTPNDRVGLLSHFIVPLPMGARLTSPNHFADVSAVGRAKSIDAERGGILGVLSVQGA